MEEKEKKERTVIHLYIKENDTHHYFGSILMFLNIFRLIIWDFLRFFTKLRIIQRKNFSKLKVHHSKRNPFVKIGGIGAKNK